jgi:hypothetical protein
LRGAGHKYFFAVAKKKFRYPGSRFFLLEKHLSARQQQRNIEGVLSLQEQYTDWIF